MTYLRVSAVALLFVTFNVVASRTLAGVDNTWIPMSNRATGAVINIGLNAIFIFGLRLGAFGAAPASVIAEDLVVANFAYGLVRGELGCSYRDWVSGPLREVDGRESVPSPVTR